MMDKDAPGSWRERELWRQKVDKYLAAHSHVESGYQPLVGSRVCYRGPSRSGSPGDMDTGIVLEYKGGCRVLDDFADTPTTVSFGQIRRLPGSAAHGLLALYLGTRWIPVYNPVTGEQYQAALGREPFILGITFEVVAVDRTQPAWDDIQTGDWALVTGSKLRHLNEAGWYHVDGRTRDPYDGIVVRGLGVFYANARRVLGAIRIAPPPSPPSAPAFSAAEVDTLRSRWRRS